MGKLKFYFEKPCTASDSLSRLEIPTALAKFPHYYLAMECQARVQMAQHKASEAVKVLRERNQNFPTAASWYALAKALEGSGQTAEANETYAEFERIARVQIDAFENANLALIHYYLCRGGGGFRRSAAHRAN